MIGSHQVDFGKHGATGEVVRVIVDVTDRVTFGDSSMALRAL
jgi:hypothetical protein